MTTVEDRPSTDTADSGAMDAHASNDHKPVGYGRMMRKEDPRFVRGMGRYVDDVVLPGMLHMAILRSPVAHARIVELTKALQDLRAGGDKGAAMPAIPVSTQGMAG